MNKLKGIFETFSINKYFVMFTFKLTISFRYVKNILVLQKDHSKNFLAIREKKFTIQ